METIFKKWCVRYVCFDSKLLSRNEFIGSIHDCVRFVEPRHAGSFAILPYEECDDLE